MNPSPDRALAVLREFACVKLREYQSQIERCARLLSHQQAWQRPNEHSNAVANLIVHLRGNLSQWAISGLGGGALSRDRPAEFALRSGPPAVELAAELRQTVEAACQIIAALTDDQLAGAIEIQAYHTTGLAAVFHVTEHFAFHTGQIIWATKAMLNVDLSLYDAQGHRRDGRISTIP